MSALTQLERRQSRRFFFPRFRDVAGTNWSAKWTGSIIPPTPKHTPSPRISDDGVRLVVNGKTLINDWTDHPATTDTGSINLVAGQAYSIELDYYQGEGGPSSSSLSSASTPQEVIEPATPIGINAGTAADYDNSLMFADAVKMSRGGPASTISGETHYLRRRPTGQRPTPRCRSSTR